MRLSRRDVLRLYAGTAASVAIAGCAPTATSNATSSAVAGGAERPSGTLRIVWDTLGTEQMDPTQQAQQPDDWPIWDSWVGAATDGTPVKDYSLIDDWQIA